MPSILNAIALDKNDVIQITDNHLENFGNLCIVEEVRDDGILVYSVNNGFQHFVFLKWGEFEFIGRARIVWKGD